MSENGDHSNLNPSTHHPQGGWPTPTPNEASPFSNHSTMEEASGKNPAHSDQLLGILSPPLEPDEIGRFGSYRVLGILGRGGMGVVVKAHDPELNRVFALKLLRPEFLAEQWAHARFLKEARAAAALCHDNVVTVFRVGKENNVPFLAMPLLDGLSLQHWLDCGRPLPLEQIVRIGVETARGLATAHARGLIHRDIKPANIWMERLPNSSGGKPVYRVKILDFGLVRAIVEGEGEVGSGPISVVGTAGYLSPEQAAGRPLDHRSDLFSLGCVLHLLCTGQRPFPTDLRQLPLSVLASVDPPRVRALNPEVPPELDELIWSLLARNLESRPSSAQAVGEVLETIEKNLTEEIQPPGSKKSPKAPTPPFALRRWPWIALGTVGLLLLAVSLTGGWLGGWFSPPGMPTGGNPNIPIEGNPQQGMPTLTLVGSFNHHTNEIRCLAYSPDGKYLATGSFDLTAAIWDVKTMKVVTRLKGHKGVVEALAFSPDSQVLITASADGSLRQWLPLLDTPILVVPIHKGGVAAVAMAKTSDGRTLLATGGEDRLAWIKETGQGGQAVRLEGHQGRVDCLAFNHDASLLASGSRDKTIRVWDVATGKPPVVLKGHQEWPSFLAFSPDGKILASAGADEKCVRLWDVIKGEEIQPPLMHRGNVHGVAFSPDGLLLAATPQRAGGVVVWEWKTGRQVAVGPGEADWAWAVAFSPDGKKLAAGDFRTLKVWEVHR